MAGITWMIDTDQYTDRQLRKLSEFVYPYDYSISKHIDAELEERKAKEDAEKKKEEAIKKATDEITRAHGEKPKGEIRLGRKPKWTPDTIREEAKKYEKRYQFSNGCPGGYSAAKGLAMMDELFPKPTLIIEE